VWNAGPSESSKTAVAKRSTMSSADTVRKIGSALAALALCAGCAGCAASKPRVYGNSGPAFQDSVYYPTQDPLFKNDVDK
jgi:hypothetical protein